MASKRTPGGAKAVKSSKGVQFREGVADQVSFLGTVFRAPRAVGAVAPTSAQSGRVMASHIDLSSGLPVLELGAGTGPITKQIIDFGLPPEKLVSIEFSGPLCRVLEKRYPDVTVIEGDAVDMKKTMHAHMGDAMPEAFDSVICALPMLNFPPHVRKRILETGLSLIGPGRPFVQISYGFVPPVNVDDDPSISLTRSRWVLKNLPPSRIWVYTRNT